MDKLGHNNSNSSNSVRSVCREQKVDNKSIGWPRAPLP